MRRRHGFGTGAAAIALIGALTAGAGVAWAAPAPAATPSVPPASAPAEANAAAPEALQTETATQRAARLAAAERPQDFMPPAPAATAEALAAGPFEARSTGNRQYRISTSGRTFTSREAIEKYLAYRAALHTVQNKGTWFEVIESRRRGDLPPPEGHPVIRYSFRMQNFLPVWTYKTASGETRTWRPYTNEPFPVDELKAATSYEVAMDIRLHDGMVTGADPLAFSAFALSDYLINQVTPPT